MAKVSGYPHVRFDNVYYDINKAYVYTKKVSIKATAAVGRIYSSQRESLCKWLRAKYGANGYESRPSPPTIRSIANGTQPFLSIQ